MNRRTTALISAAVLAAVRPTGAAGPPATRGASPRPPLAETAAFDLRPEPPPTPALLYQLAFDPADRRLGSGGAAYLQAALLLTDAEQSSADDAIDAGDTAAFDKPAAALSADPRVGTIVDLLDDAARHESGGLDAAWAEVGVDAVLPQLNPMRGLAKLLYVRAREQTRRGDVAGAVGTLRLGYQLSGAVGDGGMLLCGLVGIGSASLTDDALAKLMNRPDAPNLYWALASMPGPVVAFRRSMEGERRLQAGGSPAIRAARTDDAGPGDWPALADMAVAFRRGPGHAVPAPPPPSAEVAAEARAYVTAHPQVAAYYARRHRSRPADVAGVDPSVLVGTYLIGRFQDASDEFHKLLGQPYRVLIPRLHDLAATLRGEGLEDGNLFAIAVPAFARTVDGFARGDRTRAALTAVEALRSYAAGHGGRLPDRLVDVTDTPVPDNPVTGRPFEYRVEAGTATLGDHDPLLSDHPLEYTVRIRRP